MLYLKYLQQSLTGSGKFNCELEFHLAHKTHIVNKVDLKLDGK